MAAENNKPDPKIKVTDKRIFTTEGDLKDEFRDTVQPIEREPAASVPSEPLVEEPPTETPKSKKSKKRSPGEKIENPGTPFTLFLDSLIVNAYMSLGMIRNPYQPETPVDLEAARQMIDLIEMLEQKTAGNLEEEESEYLEAHLGDLKLAFVRRGKAL